MHRFRSLLPLAAGLALAAAAGAQAAPPRSAPRGSMHVTYTGRGCSMYTRAACRAVRVR